VISAQLCVQSVLSDRPQHCDVVLSTNAMFCKELIPDIASELAALILSEDANDPIVLSLNISLKLLKGIECVALLMKGKHPAMARGVVNEGEPVLIASGGERWYLM
jgi:hypothetical protein